MSFKTAERRINDSPDGLNTRHVVRPVLSSWFSTEATGSPDISLPFRSDHSSRRQTLRHSFPPPATSKAPDGIGKSQQSANETEDETEYQRVKLLGMSISVDEARCKDTRWLL
jgi:hypothetical protein